MADNDGGLFSVLSDLGIQYGSAEFWFGLAKLGALLLFCALVCRSAVREQRRRWQVGAPIVWARAGEVRASKPHELGRAALGADTGEAHRQQMASEAVKVQERDGGDNGARYLHQHITAEYWGITWEGFQDFMATVRASISSGSLVNTGAVPYEPEKFDSLAIGPNMYQVNEQVIKPVTAGHPQLPGVSWAFKDSSIGSRVTIFVTHAWQEGIFEFERHLQSAWPRISGEHPGAAYICFLSNPQNLDIGAMLEQIDTSPFKVALDRMPKPGFMVMCGTTNAPIHERAWCVFEAYMAIKLEIPIIIAGVGANLAQMESRAGVEYEASELVRHRREEEEAAKCPEVDEWPDNLCGLLITLACMGGISLCKMVLCMPFFKARRERVEQQAFDGHLVDVRKARCSRQADYDQIMAAIRGKEAEINCLVAECIVQATMQDKILEGP